MAYDRFLTRRDGESPFDYARRLGEQDTRGAEKLAVEERRAREREDRNRAIETAIARDLTPTEKGARMLAGFTMDYEQSVKKMQAMVGAGDFAGAQKFYNDFRNIISDNMNDLVGFTRDAVRKSGTLGSNLADRADRLLAGAFDGVEVTVPGGEKTTIGQVLGPNATYEGYKRQSLHSLGFSDAAADMYFGAKGDTARAMMQQAVGPLLDAKDRNGVPLTDGLQASDLVNWLSHTDAEGNLDNAGALEDLFGSSASLVLRDVVSSHRGSGGYAHALELFGDMGRAMQAEDEAGESLAARVSSAYKTLAQAAFAGLGDDTAPLSATDPRGQLLFDATLAKTFRNLANSNQPIDPSSPALATGLRRLIDNVKWGERMGVDLPGIAADRGSSYTDSAAAYIARGMAGSNAPGFVSGTETLRRGLDGVRGASQPDAYYSNPRAKGATEIQKAVPMSSQLTGLDGMAWGFQKAVTQAFVPKLADGSTTVDGARQAILGDAAERRSLIGSIAREVSGFIPFGSERLSVMVATALWGAWASSGGATMCVEDALRGLAGNKDAMAALGTEDARQLNTWLAANTDRSPERARWRELLTKHYDNDMMFPKDEGLRAARVSAQMAELTKAEAEGRDPEELLEAIVSQGVYYAEVPFPGGGESKSYLGKDGKPSKTFVEMAAPVDLRVVAGNQDIDAFMASQKALATRMVAEARADADFQKVEMRERVKQEAAKEKGQAAGEFSIGSD